MLKIEMLGNFSWLNKELHEEKHPLNFPELNLRWPEFSRKIKSLWHLTTLEMSLILVLLITEDTVFQAIAWMLKFWRLMGNKVQNLKR